MKKRIGIIAGFFIVFILGIYLIQKPTTQEDLSENTTQNEQTEETTESISDIAEIEIPTDGLKETTEMTTEEVTEKITEEVTEDITEVTTIDEIKEATTEKAVKDIQLTVIEEKPETTKKSEKTKKITESKKEEHTKPSDPALLDPNKKPDSTKADTAKTTKPKDSTSKKEDANTKGKIYVDGFGWIEDNGGGGKVEKSSSDGDWDKIIGY